MALAPQGACVHRRVDWRSRGGHVRGFFEHLSEEVRVRVDARVGAHRAGQVSVRGDTDQVLGAVDLQERGPSTVAVT